MGIAIVVTSGKGGTGKTTVTAGIASCLSALNKSVIAVDADIGLRNLDIVMGMSDRVLLDFYDVLAGRCRLEEALTPHPKMDRLQLLAAPATALPQDIRPTDFYELIYRLKARCDFCLIDCAAGLDTAFRLAVGAAVAAIVVSGTELVSLRDASRVAQLLDENGLHDIKLIVNRVRPYMVEKRDAANIDEAMDITGLPLLGIVPEDETVIAAANHSSPVILQGKTEAGQSFLNITRRLLGEDIPIRRKIKVSPSKFNAPPEDK